MKSNPFVDQCNASTGESSDVQPRRAILRGALAAGCSLLLPAALLGCDSGKEKEEGPGGKDGTPLADPSTSALPPDTVPGAASGPEAAAPDPGAATAKVSQASVQYQAQPKGDQQCSKCRYFIAESKTCQLVEGEINPSGWCTLWAKGDISRRERRDGKRASLFA